MSGSKADKVIRRLGFSSWMRIGATGFIEVFDYITSTTSWENYTPKLVIGVGDSQGLGLSCEETSQCGTYDNAPPCRAMF